MTTQAPFVRSSSQSDLSNRARRRLLMGSVAVAGSVIGAPAFAQARPKLRIGYWPIAGGLAFFSAIERGFFKDAGLDVEAVRFAGPNQVVEALLAGRIDGSANGTASTALALGDAQAPGLLKFFCTNYANASFVLDHIIVPKDSALKTVKEIGGKRFACGPGINNITLAKAVLERAGVPDPKVTELPFGQLLPSLAAGQLDAAYVLEPTAVIGRRQNISRILETAVISKYVLGDAQTPWHGGAAALSAEAISRHAAALPKFLDAYAKGVDYVRKAGAEANQYLKGYTAVEGDLIPEVPLSGYRMYSEMSGADVAAMQKLFDLFADKKVFEKRLMVAPLMYKA
jgi:NitT/TauT family transport system substrate-binding protein